tara:strand:- start:276 stop:713 length:438 start_codon:yes stop_codon:yes gene_type:complete
MKKNSSPKDFKAEIVEPSFKGLGTKNLQTKKVKTKSTYKKESGIPKEVANRMTRRIAITTGLPTLTGMGVFVGSYYLITEGIAEIAPVLTLMTSGACFLIGLVGLSYGILSASWDKQKGSLLGLENIRPNIKRMKEAFNSDDGLR